MNDELVTGADHEVDRQVVQRRKSAEGSRKQGTYTTTEGQLSKHDADVDVTTPASNPVQETESSLELSRMSIISSDCVRLPIVPVDQKANVEKLEVWPYTHACVCV